jgi:D-alanyl-D-alanine dipeptidase
LTVKRFAGLAIVFLSSAAPIASGAPSQTTDRLRAAHLWNVQSLDPDIRVDVRYATRRNFTGRRLPGYCRAWVMMKPRPARSLALVQRDLEKRGLGLKVFDGYRPARASRAMVRWAYRTGHGYMVGRYIASRSNHNRGHAVDLTLVHLRSGRELRLGRYDSLRRSAHTQNARGRKLRNRMILVRAMRRRGFSNYYREWWHFEHRIQTARLLNIPLGC